VSQFFLKGPGWKGIGDDKDAEGCILVVVNAGGNRYCFGTRDVEVNESGDYNPMHFIGCILNDPVASEEVDPFSRNVSVQKFRFNVGADFFPIKEMRQAGIILQDSDVDVYWYVTNRGFTLEQALHILSGKLLNPSYNEEKNVSSFEVEDIRLIGEEPFPPLIATGDKLDGVTWTVDTAFNGKPYPIVIGAIKQLPIIRMTQGVGDDRYLVMHDPFSEYSANPVTTVYENDSDLGVINAQDRDTDEEDNPYWYAEVAGPPTSASLTADVTGHTPATLDETITYLLRFFGNKSDMFDVGSIEDLKRAFVDITLGFAVNNRETDGVLGIIRNRLSSLLPFATIQKGAQYVFKPLLWDRDVVKHLSFKKNIVRKISGPIETRRSQIFNSFTVNYDRSGLRGDFNGSIVRDWNNSEKCSLSEKRYGKRAFGDIDAGDLADSASAKWLMNWLIETYSIMRVFVGYECSLDVANVQLFDTVSIDDEYEGWDHGPLFKVIGITRPTGTTIGLSLVNKEDYVDVYAVNQPIVAYSPTIAPDTLPALGGGWGDGRIDKTDGDVGDGNWGDGTPDGGPW